MRVVGAKASLAASHTVEASFAAPPRARHPRAKASSAASHAVEDAFAAPESGLLPDQARTVGEDAASWSAEVS